MRNTPILFAAALIVASCCGSYADADPRAGYDAVDRGFQAQAKGDLAGAIAAYGQALAIEPKSASVYFARGFVRARAGDIAGAIADYEQATKLDPNLVDAYRNRAILFAKTQRRIAPSTIYRRSSA